MSRTIEVSDATYEKLESLASASGTTPAEWIAATARRADPAPAKLQQPRDPSETRENGTPLRAVDLSDDVYTRIEAEATAAGITVAEWIAAQAPRPCGEACPTSTTFDGLQQTDAPGEIRTLADRMAGRIGRLRSDRTDLSERASELFAEGLLEKKKAGTL